MNPGSPERLQFALPAFTRHSWGSTQAQAIWRPRIQKIVRAWLDVEWLSVAAGVRPCALVWALPEALPQLIRQWEAARLSAIRLAVDSPKASPDPAGGLICIAVGELNKLDTLRTAYLEGDHHIVGTLLGYPQCCREFFQKVWVDKQCRDTTWWMAENTGTVDVERVARIVLPPSTPPLANILWRWMGVRAVSHLPCRFDCEATIAMATRLLEVGREAGYAKETEWIHEVLSWPVEWSALHGIAEVKSPVLKVSTSTDSTAHKWSVQWVGSAYPTCGLTGLRFPYRPPRSHGLTVLTPQSKEVPAWPHVDNGFSSPEAMRALHDPLVSMSRVVVTQSAGDVLDLGCGNGMLLAKVCALRDGLTPYGVDSNSVAIQHAREVSPQFAENFVHGDLFDVEGWKRESSRYVLAFLMLGRLREVSREQAEWLLAHLRTSATHILCYVYPDWGSDSLAKIAAEFGLELQEHNGSTAYLRSPS